MSLSYGVRRPSIAIISWRRLRKLLRILYSHYKTTSLNLKRKSASSKAR